MHYRPAVPVSPAPANGVAAPQAATGLLSLGGCPPAMTRLLAAIQELSQVRTVAEIREIVRHAARELTGADGATFVLRDVDRCHYVDEDAIAPLWKGQKFPMSACISGWAMLHGEPAVIEDIYKDSRIPVDAYRKTFVKSLVMVPIRPGNAIGAIGNYWSTHHRASPDEVKVLQALANTTSVALENVRVYQELEDRVQQRTQELVRTNDELEQFAASVSHDLRAPLAVINGYSDLLAASAASRLDTKQREMLERIPVQVARMSALIEDLLRLSRIGRMELKRERVDLTALAREIAGPLAAANGRTVEFSAESLPEALGDRSLLRIAFENLLANAWKYTGKHQQPRVAFGANRGEDGTCTYFVRDNGAGFKMDDSHRLFRPFQRLHSLSEYPGTGVGLATVARIVEKHGGRIWAEAKQDEGATFYFTLPEPGAVGGPHARD